ncbi:RNA-binding protein 48 isoform X1 [Pantherophis guttatus]|uniref:RNA-binding protein 48 n=1 Tax=Pantherophis guttatus TaxID=94885 RepID=A0A6P9AM58_PANGU|nr:RNA-binding protein 48 isoform X1 [Pantherophis guttatus]XP_034258259.1 RNA-binding protein 48 isoform X1 [Pantherophis guttatus]XP_034258260.1 RNA-binding protein 48 isoform X1 [Pantherophis guttatus]
MAAVDAGDEGEVGGVCQHHAQQTICASRAKYREGRRPRAVKVYTVNLESRYLLIQGVPALGVMKELIELFALYGTIEEYNPLDGYPAEEFTEVYLIKFLKIPSARAAKRKLDERSFFGSLLHICYAPEFESVQETRDKLRDRRKYIAKATNFSEQSLETKQDRGIRSSKIMPLDHGSWTSKTAINKWNPATYTQDPCQSSCCTLLLKDITSPAEQHCQNMLVAPHYSHHYATTSACFSQKIRMDKKPQQREHDTLACWNLEKKVPCYEGLGRFMPRTTQLQERKRRRDEDNKLALLGREPNGEEIIFGPRLPEIPKIDLDDDSLNTSAILIRNRLKKIADPVQTSNSSEELLVENQATPIIKQRRRI